jgi:outer membrane protein OmpA-like peptidoglycan-associated protein
MRCDTNGAFDSCNLNGWNAALDINAHKNFSVVLDFGGHYGTLGESPDSLDLKFHTFMIGPRLKFPSERFTPFVHALVGMAQLNSSVEGNHLFSDKLFSMAFGGGLDINLNRRIAVRPVQVDYLTERRQGEFLDNFRYSGGIVIKLGITNRPPTISCSTPQPSIVRGATTTIRADASDPDRDKLTYSWSASAGKISGQEGNATFDTAGLKSGNYTVTATVRDKKHEVSCSTAITVLNQAPTATVEPASFDITQGESANLRCAAKDPDNDPLTYAWSVNGERLAAAGPQVTFGSEGRKPGSYTVTCEVSDGEATASGSSRGNVRERIIPNQPPSVECLTTTMDVASGGSIELRARATDPDKDNLTYTWSSTGGSVSGRGETATFNASGVNAGSYTVTVTVDDGRGGKSSCSMTVNVSEKVSITKDNCGYFKEGAARVDNCAKAILDDIAVRMKNDSKLHANVIGYTDGSSFEKSRKNLGEKRAKAVADYLEKQGVETSRMTVTDGGANNPVGDNKTAAGRKLNRRVEIELAVK